MSTVIDESFISDMLYTLEAIKCLLERNFHSTDYAEYVELIELINKVEELT